METGNFREFHTVAEGNFLISEREFPVALVWCGDCGLMVAQAT